MIVAILAEIQIFHENTYRSQKSQLDLKVDSYFRRRMCHVNVHKIGEKQPQVRYARQLDAVHVLTEIHPVALVAEYLGELVKCRFVLLRQASPRLVQSTQIDRLKDILYTNHAFVRTRKLYL